MRTSLLIIFFSFTAILYSNNIVAQLVITAENNAQALAQRLVGTGVTISNVTLTGAPYATGFFNNISGTKISIDSGIVLTNGLAKSGETTPPWGVNGNGTVAAQNALANTDQHLAGDADLARLLGIPRTDTHDACVLEFDFVPLGDSIKFNYVFSSEEYTAQYVCSFNDAFAFFISGPGIPALKNIALIPNTNTPVSIFNVNDVIGSTCPNNMAYFTNNISNKFFTHDGHTVMLTAMEQVQPCQTYHLKLVIADVGDGLFDSGVFLQAKSLSSNAISLSNNTQVDPQNNNYLVEGCSAGSFKIKRANEDNSPLTVFLSYSGTAGNGTDLQLLPASVTIPPLQSEVTVNLIPIVDNIPEGIEVLKIYASTGSGCGPSVPNDSALIQIRDYDTLGIQPDTAIICKGSTVQLIASAGYTIYKWDANPTLSSTIVRNPFATPANHVTTYYCTSTEGACHGRDSALIILKDLDLLSTSGINCKNGTTGEIKVSGGPEWVRPAVYSINNNPYQADSTFSSLAVGPYTVRVKDAAGCIDSLLINLPQLYPDLVILTAPVTPASCSGNADATATINVTGGNNPYLFSADGINFQNSNVLNLTQGNYLVTVKDNNSCVATKNVVISLNNTVTLDAGADATICEGKTIQLNASSNAAAFVWSPAATLNSNIIHDPLASPIQTTKYIIVATTGICTQKDSVTIFVNPAPKANAGPDHTICYGQNVQLNGSGGLNYTWFPASYLDDPRIAVPTARLLPGSISYFLNVTDGKGCVSLKKDTVLITVTRPAVVNAGNDTVLAIGQPLPLAAKDVNNIGFIQYEWSPVDGLNDPFIANPVTILDKNILYTVTARTAIGCEATDNIKITVYRGPDIYVPNAFSPNADGVNDILRAKPVGIKDFHYLRIYNRWGELIFFTTDALKGWDGNIKSTGQSTGTTYAWIAEGVDYKGNTIQRKGTITIVK